VVVVVVVVVVEGSSKRALQHSWGSVLYHILSCFWWRVAWWGCVVCFVACLYWGLCVALAWCRPDAACRAGQPCKPVAFDVHSRGVDSTLQLRLQCARLARGPGCAHTCT
jgi:hypothetical protein